MNAVVSILRELVGLFVDDGSLALAIVAVIALAGILSILMPNMPLLAGAILLFGCLGLLLANVARAAQSR
jgi:hypothetical protein